MTDADGIDREYEYLRGIDVFKQAALDRLGGREPVCDSCGETEPLVLHIHNGAVSCYECTATRGGRSRVEEHHTAGRLNTGDTIAIGGNDHRMLSGAQALWPTDTLRNPHQSPLLTIAAAIRGWLDIMRHIIYHSVGWIPDALEHLNDLLVDLHGPIWWTRPTATPP